MGRIYCYETRPGAWVVAENDQWLPGVYDSEQTARAATWYENDRLLSLGHIYRVDGEDRPLTLADLAQP